MDDSSNSGLWKYTRHFLEGIRNPDKIAEEQFSWKNFIMTINGSAILLIPIALLFKFSLALNEADTYSLSSKLFKPDFGQLFYVVLLGPIIEEITYRLPLNNDRKTLSIAFAASIISVITITYLRNYFPYHLLLTPLFFLAVYSLKPKSQYLFWGSNSLFCLLHIPTYYDIFGIVSLVLLVLMLGYFSLILSFIRLKFGLRYAVLLHILQNTTAIAFMSVNKI